MRISIHGKYSLQHRLFIRGLFISTFHRIILVNSNVRVVFSLLYLATISISLNYEDMIQRTLGHYKSFISHT